jgi:hypothetical protein
MTYAETASRNGEVVSRTFAEQGISETLVIGVPRSALRLRSRDLARRMIRDFRLHRVSRSSLPLAGSNRPTASGAPLGIC